LDFTGARDSKWQWHQLGRMQIRTSLQTDNHASTSYSVFLRARCPSCHPTNSVKALNIMIITELLILFCCLQCFDAVGWAAGRASGL